ncbi:MAG: class I SAM-dependent methyltransferase [Fusobacteriaceae bacterium]
MSLKLDNDNTLNSDIFDVFEEILSQKGEILDLECGKKIKCFIDSGYTRHKFNIADLKDINFENRFVGVLACASLIYLPDTDILEVIKKFYKVLKKGGVIYISFKYGKNNDNKIEQDLNLFTRERFLELVKDLNFYYKATFETYNIQEDKKTQKWLNIFLKRN